MNKLKNLKGAKVLSSKEQQVLKGGLGEPCFSDFDCLRGRFCWNGVCALDRPKLED